MSVKNTENGEKLILCTDALSLIKTVMVASAHSGAEAMREDIADALGAVRNMLRTIGGDVSRLSRLEEEINVKSGGGGVTPLRRSLSGKQRLCE
jgi:hypothetical protein